MVGGCRRGSGAVLQVRRIRAPLGDPELQLPESAATWRPTGPNASGLASCNERVDDVFAVSS